MRYTPYTGLTQVSNWEKLKFAAMNLKKLAKWKWNSNEKASLFHKIKLIFALIQKNPCFA